LLDQNQSIFIVINNKVSIIVAFAEIYAQNPFANLSVSIQNFSPFALASEVIKIYPDIGISGILGQNLVILSY